MTKYYVRFNYKTEKVDVYRRSDDSIIRSVEVVNGIVDTTDVEDIADALDITSNNGIRDLDYAIFYEDREGREALKEII